MKNSFLSIVLLLLSCSGSLFGQEKSLPRSTPEAEGVSTDSILGYLEAAKLDKQGLHSFMMLRHGKVIAEAWWEVAHPDVPHVLNSVSKTYTSTAVGFAVSEGLLSIDDKVIKFFPEYLPDTVSPYLASLSVKHLLCMGLEHDKEIDWSNPNWIKTFLAMPIMHEPGSTFAYNSAGSYMLSAIVQKVTGKKVLDYLEPRLFEPLGITKLTSYDYMGINLGGWGMFAKTEDMAKLGQFYLQKGRWNGKQLLPESWINEATTKHIEQQPNWTPEQKSINDWAQGYCYQMWRCRHNAYRADGAAGQFIIVIPESDAVIAITARMSDMQRELNLVWDHLLPGIQGKPLPANKAKEKELQVKLAWLKYELWD